jgi:tetratricopeptide (TPR) repeat protein
MGAIFGRLGRYEEALRYQQEHLEMRRKIYKGDHAIAISAKFSQSVDSSYTQNEFCKVSGEKPRSFSAVEEKSTGIVNDAIIALSLNSIGNTLQRLDRDEEALQSYRESLGIMRRIYQGGHIYIANSLDDIGKTLQRLGRYEEALQSYQESLEMMREIYKDDHADIAAALNNIGTILRNSGLYDKALQSYQESLEMRRRIYKSDHDDIADSLNNIGTTLQKLDRYEEALQSYQEGLKIIQEIYQGDHTDIAASLNNIGATLVSLGKYEEALHYQQESLKMMRRIYQGDHVHIANSLNNIVATLVSSGRYEEALQYQQESLEMKRKIYKDDHADIAKSLSHTGGILESLGRYEESLQPYLESLEMRRRIYKDAHADIVVSLNKIGTTLQSLGRYEEALKYLSETYIMLQKCPTHPYIQIVVQRNIFKCTVCSANNEILIGNNDKALAYFIKVGFDANASKLRNIVEFLATQSMQLGNLDLSISCFEVLSEKLSTDNRRVKHKIACMYHVKALREQVLGHKDKYLYYLNKAIESFEQAISMISAHSIRASLYAAYAQFLIKHYQEGNQNAYDKIISLLMQTIEHKDDGSRLRYGKLEQDTTVKPLQRIIGLDGKVSVPPASLARYLWIKIHLLNDNKVEANKSLEEFVKAVKKSPRPIACTLLGYSYQEYDAYLEQDRILSEQAAKLHSESTVQNLDTNSNLGLARQEESKQSSAASPTFDVNPTAISKTRDNQNQQDRYHE